MGCRTPATLLPPILFSVSSNFFHLLELFVPDSGTFWKLYLCMAMQLFSGRDKREGVSPVQPKNVSTLITMCEYSRKGMRVLTQVDESTYVIHRLYGKNRHSKLITHNSKLITENSLHEASAYTPACMCQRFSMCVPIHTYVFAVRCIIFRRILLYLSEKPTKGFPKFFGVRSNTTVASLLPPHLL